MSGISISPGQDAFETGVSFYRFTYSDTLHIVDRLVINHDIFFIEYPGIY